MCVGRVGPAWWVMKICTRWSSSSLADEDVWNILATSHTKGTALLEKKTATSKASVWQKCCFWGLNRTNFHIVTSQIEFKVVQALAVRNNNNNNNYSGVYTRVTETSNIFYVCYLYIMYNNIIFIILRLCYGLLWGVILISLNVCVNESQN